MVLSRENLAALKILNPWRTGFILILLANLIFHSSPAILLLLILAAIFGYAFFVVSKFFVNYAEHYATGAATPLNVQYLDLILQYKNVISRIVNLRAFNSVCRVFVLAWGSNILTYKCLELSNEANYMLLELGGLYAITSNYFVNQGGRDLFNPTGRNSYLESSLELFI